MNDAVFRKVADNTYVNPAHVSGVWKDGTKVVIQLVDGTRIAVQHKTVNDVVEALT